MIQRYALGGLGDDWYMERDDDGDYVRYEDMPPREPTVAMLRVNVGNPFNNDQPCSGCLLGEVWRTMWDAASKTGGTK